MTFQDGMTVLVTGGAGFRGKANFAEGATRRFNDILESRFRPLGVVLI